MGGAPSATLQPGYPPSQPPRSAKGQPNGSYGLSIRVQGIDGHPYVVLNNQDRPTNPYAPSNGHRDPEGSFIDDYQEYDFRGPSPFVEFRSQKPVSGGANPSGPMAGLKENRDPQQQQQQQPPQAASRSPNLLNFQRHPELLKPYDPESNTLEGFRSVPGRPQGAIPTPSVPTTSSTVTAATPATHARSSSLDQPPVQVPRMPAQKQTHPRPYPSKSQPQPLVSQKQKETPSQSHGPVQSQVKPKAQPQAAPTPAPAPAPAPSTQVPSKPAPSQRVPVPQAAPASDAPPAPFSRRSPSVASSANSSLERGSGSGSGTSSVFTGSPSHAAREPDVLPLRRVDSSGPVLQSTSSAIPPRSRHSSASSTATSGSAPPNRTLSPGRPAADELEALYAESINRHQNRRYIPFLPGTGRDIDTEPLAGVDQLISHFDGSGTQRRGRTGRRGRIDPEDRKRSRSVDSALPFGLSSGDEDYLEQVSRARGRLGEHVLRPSQLGLKKGSGGCGVSPSLTLPASRRGASTRDLPRGSSAPGSPQGSLSRGFRRLNSSPSVAPQEEGQAEAGSKVKTSVTTTSLSRPATRTNSSPKAKGPEIEPQVRLCVCRRVCVLFLSAS